MRFGTVPNPRIHLAGLSPSRTSDILQCSMRLSPPMRSVTWSSHIKSSHIKSVKGELCNLIQCRSSSKCATCAALALAQAVFEAKPSANTTALHAVITHQIACVAVVKSMPCTRLALTTVPDTATPRAAPTCRLVDAIAAATPACDSGIPATALLVIAGFTMPSPTPNSAYATASQTTGVC